MWHQILMPDDPLHTLMSDDGLYTTVSDYNRECALTSMGDVNITRQQEKRCVHLTQWTTPWSAFVDAMIFGSGNCIIEGVQCDKRNGINLELQSASGFTMITIVISYLLLSPSWDFHSSQWPFEGRFATGPFSTHFPRQNDRFWKTPKCARFSRFSQNLNPRKTAFFAT